MCVIKPYTMKLGTMEVTWKYISKSFYLFCCVIATIVLILNCFYNFWLDEDTSQISFKTYPKGQNSMYPSISLCFDWPFYTDRLVTFGNGLNASTYSKFLSGEVWDERFLHVEYDNVTVNLESYLSLIEIKNTNDEKKVYNYENKQNDTEDQQASFYVSSRSSDEKCFSMDIPNVGDDSLKTVEIWLKNKFLNTRDMELQKTTFTLHSITRHSL